MKVLTDENIMKKLCDLFRDFGHDVKSIDTKLKGISDEEVLQITLDEKRILVSNDRKFCKSLKGKEHYGVILIRTDVKYQRETLKKFLEKDDLSNMHNRVVTLTKDQYEICDYKKRYRLPKVKIYPL